MYNKIMIMRRSLASTCFHINYNFTLVAKADYKNLVIEGKSSLSTYLVTQKNEGFSVEHMEFNHSIFFSNR
jgi:hypothetical protein